MEDKEEICHIFYFIFSSVLYDLFLLSVPKSLDFLSPAKAFSTEWPRYQVSEYQILYIYIYRLPDSSAGKESVCNAGDPSSVSGSGRSPGEGTGYLLQHSWTSLVAQAVKNQPAIQETWVESLDWEDLLEEGMATHSSILTWRIPWTV